MKSSMENLIRVADNIYLVPGPRNGQFPYCHCFLFTGGENILLDAGADEELLADLDKDVGIDTLVISHTHPDHIRRWHIFDQRRIIIPEESPDSVFDMDSLGLRFTGSADSGVHWAEVVARSSGIRALRQPDARYSEGHVFNNGSVLLQAIHAPGHLDDHYCFFEHNSGTLITIDIDFTSFGPWYGNPEGRIRPFIKSIERVMGLPYKRACSSHRMPFEGDAAELFNAYLDSFERQKGEVLSLVKGGLPLRN